MTNQTDKRDKKASGSEGPKLLNKVLIVAAVGVALWFAFFGGDGGEEALIQGATVKRGFVEITVVERGNLASKNAASIKSEIEGRATILSMVTEGTFVEAGDIVCELDTTDEINRIVGAFCLGTDRRGGSRTQAPGTSPWTSMLTRTLTCPPSRGVRSRWTGSQRSGAEMRPSSSRVSSTTPPFPSFALTVKRGFCPGLLWTSSCNTENVSCVPGESGAWPSRGR